MNEAEYLRKQADDARTAIARDLSDLASDTAHLADPRRWTRSHPWISLGVALVGGIAVGNAVMPPKEDPEAKLREASFYNRVKVYVNRVVAAAKGETSAAVDEAEAAAKKVKHEAEESAQGSGWVATILKEAFHFARPIITSLVAAQLGKAQADAEQHNGHPTTANAQSGASGGTGSV